MGCHVGIAWQLCWMCGLLSLTGTGLVCIYWGILCLGSAMADVYVGPTMVNAGGTWYWHESDQRYYSVPVGGWPEDVSVSPFSAGQLGDLAMSAGSFEEAGLMPPESVLNEPMPGFDGSSVSLAGVEAGTDLRDIQMDGFAGPVAGTVAMVGLRAVLARLGAAGGPIARFFGGATAGSLRTWNSLPGWVQTILLTIGISRGTSIIMDLVGGRERESDGRVPVVPGGPGPGALPSQVIGSWLANGVVFYRLFDGRLAVKNKHGRWKIWRPKKPIVLMPSGANNLRNILRADAVLNRQAKKIAAMLNRRAPRRPAARPPAQVVVAGDDVLMLPRGRRVSS